MSEASELSSLLLTHLRLFAGLLGSRCPHASGWQPRSLMALRVLRLSAHRLSAHINSARDHTTPARPPGRSRWFENLRSCPSRHGPPRVSIGWFVSRAPSGSGYWLAGRARARPRRPRGVIGCRAVEWPVRAPEGDVVWRARRGVPLLRGAAGRPGPAAGGQAGAAEPGVAPWAGRSSPPALPGPRRVRPTRRLQGSEAGERSAPRGSESAAS